MPELTLFALHIPSRQDRLATPSSPNAPHRAAAACCPTPSIAAACSTRVPSSNHPTPIERARIMARRSSMLSILLLAAGSARAFVPAAAPSSGRAGSRAVTRMYECVACLVGHALEPNRLSVFFFLSRACVPPCICIHHHHHQSQRPTGPPLLSPSPSRRHPPAAARPLRGASAGGSFLSSRPSSRTRARCRASP